MFFQACLCHPQTWSWTQWPRSNEAVRFKLPSGETHRKMKDFALDGIQGNVISHPQTGSLNKYLFLEEQGFLEKSPACVGIPNQQFILLSFAEDRLRKYFFCWELSHIPSLFGTCASMIFPDRSVKPSAEKWLEDCGFFEKGLLLLVLGRVSLPCKWWFTNIRQQKSLLHKFHNLHGQYVEGWLNISKLTFNSPISATHKGRGGIYITYKEELVGRVSIPNPRCLKMTHMTIAHVMSL